MHGVFIFFYSTQCFLHETKVFFPQHAFTNPGRAFVKVMVMMIGEIEFDDTFIQTIGKKSDTSRAPLNLFPSVSFVFLTFFLLLMSIILMNLLVGRLDIFYAKCMKHRQNVLHFFLVYALLHFLNALGSIILHRELRCFFFCFFSFFFFFFFKKV